MFGNSSMASKATVLWKCRIRVILWVVWIEKNRIIFEDNENDLKFL